MVNKTLNGLAPDYMRSMFTDRGGVTSYSLRDTECKLHVTIPIPRTNYRNDSFGYSDAVLWNSLPVEVKNLNQFRAGCRKYF